MTKKGYELKSNISNQASNAGVSGLKNKKNDIKLHDKIWLKP